MFLLINPENEKADFLIGDHKYFSAEVCDRLPTAIKVLSLIQIVGTLISAFLHERPTPEETQK